jgi:S-adenosylmethionine/arginine decarboxylase-like enzyme
MEIKDYDDIIKAISQQVAEEFFSRENELSKRAILLDQDIARIVKQIGLETTKIVLEKIRDELVSKKNSKD